MKPRSVFTMGLFDYRRGVLGWSVGMFVMLALMTSIYPSITGIQGLDQLLSEYPEAFMSVFGLDAGTDFTSAIGYLEAELFSFMVPLAMVGFAIAIGARFVAGDEERGTLGLTLARPVTRMRFALAKAGGLAVLTAGLGALVFVTLWLAGPVLDLRVAVAHLLATVLATTLLAWLFGTVAFAVGCATGRRSLATSAAWSLAALAYLWNGLAPLVERLADLTWLSPFEWALGGHPLRSGFDGGGSLALVAATLVVMAIGLVVFNRRDLAG